MASIKVSRAHCMEISECRAKAEELLEMLVERFGGSFYEEGDEYAYKHPTGLKAKVAPTEDLLTIDVKLTLMTMALGPKLDQEINRQLDKHFS